MSGNIGLIVAIVAVIALVVIAAMLIGRRRRSRQLQERFGPEYERAVAAHGDRGRAESELNDRLERRKEFQVRELDPAERARFSESWRSVQSRFVDDPKGSVEESDHLVGEVMRARGYPVGHDTEDNLASVSVDHADVVDNYRRAHAISQASRAGRATTDHLREAIVLYRSLFMSLLGDTGAEPNQRGVESRRRPEVT